MNLIIEDAGRLIPCCVLESPKDGESEKDFLERITKTSYPGSVILGWCDQIPFLDDKDHDESVKDKVAFKLNPDKVIVINNKIDDQIKKLQDQISVLMLQRK